MINDLEPLDRGLDRLEPAARRDQGGPNHVGNFCSAPILADASSDTFSLHSSYYYIGHFARFVRPGARRVLCTAGRQDLEAASFVNPDGAVATIAMNRTGQPLRFALRIDGMRTTTELPPRSVATYVA